MIHGNLIKYFLKLRFQTCIVLVSFISFDKCLKLFSVTERRKHLNVFFFTASNLIKKDNAVIF